jgi:hypothetical protein
MKMKKMRLLMLTLLIGGAVSMHAQVRIGGTVDPNPNALLDVNIDDNITTGNNTKGLALPRVSLTSTTVVAPVGTDFVRGMLVYNTATDGTSPNNVTPGVYYCDGSKWVKVGHPTVEVDGFIGNEMTGVIPGRGLYTTGQNTANFLVGIADNAIGTEIQDNAVTSAKIADGTIALVDLAAMGASTNYMLRYNGSAWTVVPIGIRIAGWFAKQGTLASGVNSGVYVTATTADCNNSLVTSVFPTGKSDYSNGMLATNWEDITGGYRIQLRRITPAAGTGEIGNTMFFACVY